MKRIAIRSSRLAPLLSAISERSENEAGDRQNGKDNKQNLGDAHGTGGNAAKAEQRSDQRNNEKNNGIVQHD